VENKATDTIQNIFYSDKIMKQHGWTSAEVVSSPSHLPRAGLILEHYHFEWRTRRSKWSPAYSWLQLIPFYAYEALRTTQLRWFGFRHSEYLPGS
jgi:uncharacterized SAM-binding protein YcdF (DUF218 family)